MTAKKLHPYTADIKRVGNLYTAIVEKRPYCPAWTSPKPMTAQELYNALKSMGHDSVDIMDAFHAGDPEWSKRNPDFRT